MIFAVFVDDLCITGTDEDEIQRFRQALLNKFGTGQGDIWTDSISSFLGIDCSYDENSYSLSLTMGAKITKLLDDIDFG